MDRQTNQETHNFLAGGNESGSDAAFNLKHSAAKMFTFTAVTSQTKIYDTVDQNHVIRYVTQVTWSQTPC